MTASPWPPTSAAPAPSTRRSPTSPKPTPTRTNATTPRSRPPSKTAEPRRPPKSEPDPAGPVRKAAMADVTTDMDADHAASLGRRYLIRFEEDTLRQRPLWIRLIIEFLGTFVLVTVAAGSGDQSLRGRRPDQPGRGGDRARGGGHGHDLRLGPAVGTAHQPGGDLRLHRPRGVPTASGWCRTGWSSSPGRSVPPCSCS